MTTFVSPGSPWGVRITAEELTVCKRRETGTRTYLGNGCQINYAPNLMSSPRILTGGVFILYPLPGPRFKTPGTGRRDREQEGDKGIPYLCLCHSLFGHSIELGSPHHQSALKVRGERVLCARMFLEIPCEPWRKRICENGIFHVYVSCTSLTTLLISGLWFPYLLKEEIVFKGRLQIQMIKRLVGL